MPEPLLLFPFSGNAREAASIIAFSKELNGKWEVIGFIDDNAGTHAERFSGIPVLGGREKFGKFPDAKVLAVPGRPDNFLERRNIITRLGIPRDRLATVVAPNASILTEHRIGVNTLILSNVVVGSGVIIGDHCVILPNTTVGHDAVINDYCLIGANAALSGNVTVEENCYIGTGATVREKIIIHKESLVGIGANVIKHVEANSTVAGNPARPLKVTVES